MKSQSSAPAAWQFCNDTLPHVSRTFALTVPVLPPALRDPVCCAYLLCRIADTIEDRPDLPPATRHELYTLLSDSMNDPAVAVRFVDRWPRLEDRHLQDLMAGLGTVLEAYETLPDGVRRHLRTCVLDMVAGMSKTPDAQGDQVVFVSASLADLEQYCHYVAGTVGIMLTDLFTDHLGLSLDRARGHRFGLGLQLTNILKDQKSDVGRGTCFVPRDWLDDQLQLNLAARRSLVERTLSHLRAAHEYTLQIPAQQDGMRLFCLWAMWMAVATLREVARARVPAPKISRLEVAQLVAESRLKVAKDGALSDTFERLYGEVTTALLEPSQGLKGRP